LLLLHNDTPRNLFFHTHTLVQKKKQIGVCSTKEMRRWKESERGLWKWEWNVDWFLIFYFYIFNFFLFLFTTLVVYDCSFNTS
jgi:hypothetical protein